MNEAGMGMKIGISMTLVYKDKDGNVIGTTDAKGSFPLESLTEEQQTTILKELNNGTHD